MPSSQSIIKGCISLMLPCTSLPIPSSLMVFLRGKQLFLKGEHSCAWMTVKQNFRLLPILSWDLPVTVHQHLRITEASPPPNHLCPLHLHLPLSTVSSHRQSQDPLSRLCSFKRCAVSEKLEALRNAKINPTMCLSRATSIRSPKIMTVSRQMVYRRRLGSR